VINYYFNNRRFELRELVKDYLKGRITDPSVYGGYGYNSFGNSGNKGTITVHSVRDVPGFNMVRIYFYEFSNLYHTPRTFTSVKDFEDFCKKYELELNDCQKTMIATLGIAYVACYEGFKDLNIRGSYKNLKDTMGERGALKLMDGIVNNKFKL